MGEIDVFGVSSCPLYIIAKLSIYEMYLWRLPYHKQGASDTVGT